MNLQKEFAVNMIDPEKLFKLLEGREWDGFLELLHNHKNEICGSPVANQALQHFHLEYEKDLESPGEATCSVDSLRKIYLFQTARIHKFPDSMFNIAMGKLLENYRSQSLKKAFDLAVSIDHVPEAASIIAEYAKTQPVKVSHSQENNISIQRNQAKKAIGTTISLFKSNQEKNFFRAVVDSFPNFHTYPNVAVSCLVDFSSIKNGLDRDERKYFFTSIVDCVVFDVSDGYKPKYFFEVDSIYHDSEEQKKKDRYKDKFFSLCGESLFRVRALSKEAAVDDFRQLVAEVVKEKLL